MNLQEYVFAIVTETNHNNPSKRLRSWGYNTTTLYWHRLLAQDILCFKSSKCLANTSAFLHYIFIASPAYNFSFVV